MVENEVWAPQECTLPAARPPARVTEFDALFADAVRASSRLAPTRLRLVLDGGYERAARDLAAREGECCSFFAFDFTPDGDQLMLDITVPPAQAAVLDAVAERAARPGVSG